MPRDKIGPWIKRHTLSLNGSDQGIRLGLLHCRSKGSVPGIGENNRKRATYQHGQNQKGEHRTKGHGHIGNGHTRAQSRPIERKKEPGRQRKSARLAFHITTSLSFREKPYLAQLLLFRTSFSHTYRSLIFRGVLKNPHRVSYKWWV